MADGRHTPRILVDDRQTTPVDVQGLARLAEVALLGEGAERTELSVSFVTDEEIADLHRRYMDRWSRDVCVPDRRGVRGCVRIPRCRDQPAAADPTTSDHL